MRKFLGVLVLLLFPAFLRAQCTGSSPTWTSTPDQTSVGTCVSKASAGDTINVSAGTGSVTWSGSTINITKPLSLIFPGQSALTITDSQCQMFNISESVVGSLMRISGFTVTPTQSPACAPVKALATCTLSGCPNIRIDHITFNNWAGVCCSGNGNSFGLMAISNFFGVLDHNTVNGNSSSLNFLQLCECSMGNFLGQGSYGDYSWNQPENYGSSQFLFIENNIFNHAGCCENEARAASFSDQGGGRVVVRFNTFTMDNRNSAMFWHGTESDGRPRGGRTWEFYANTGTCVQISGLNCGSILGPRSGTGLSWGNSNTITGAGASNFLGFNTYRAVASIGWGPCDGSSVWDVNDGITHYSGTVASYDSTTHTITVSGTPGWTTNQWIPAGAPYSVHDLTKTNGAEITGNGSNTLSINVGSGGPGDWVPAVGDSIQVLRATSCVDQGGGRGAGAILYSGVNGSVPTSPLASSAQVSSPSYLWANPWTGGTPAGYVGSNTKRVIANRDWYADAINQAAQSSPTSPFNGSSGTGYGTVGNRPTTCTTGVGYWAEDQGNWNTNNTTIPGTGASTQGQFYVCTATNIWTLAYTPYTYPHPLTNSTGSTENVSAPTGLTATVQ